MRESAKKVLGFSPDLLPRARRSCWAFQSISLPDVYMGYPSSTKIRRELDGLYYSCVVQSYFDIHFYFQVGTPNKSTISSTMMRPMFEIRVTFFVAQKDCL